MRNIFSAVGCLMFNHCPNRRVDKVHLREIKTMTVWQRLCHYKTRRHLAGLALGFGIMSIGVGMAWGCEHWSGPARFFTELSAWFVHGVGACPFIGHLTPLWRVFAITTEEVA
jgi:hypothetical protein